MGAREQLAAFIRHVLSLTEDKELKDLLVPLVGALKKQVESGVVKSLDLREEVGKLAREQNRRGVEASMKFLPALETLKRVWGTQEDYVPLVDRMYSMEHLIRVHRAELEDLATFACSDAPLYREYIRPGFQDEVDRRNAEYKEWTKTHFNAEAVASKYGAKEQYSLHDIQAGGGITLQARSACCTTFAIAAAYVLTRGHKNTGVRVECVAIPQKHCFVIVGRNGDILKAERERPKLPARDNWGDQAYVIDPWLGSIGHGVIYRCDDYPLKKALDNLESKFDSKAPDVPGTDNQFEAILAEKKKLSPKCPQCGSEDVEKYSSSSTPDGFKCKKCKKTGKRNLFL